LLQWVLDVGFEGGLMLRVSHYQPDLAHLDEEPTDIIQWKKEGSFAPEMRCR
jgi:hypothetical protein